MLNRSTHTVPFKYLVLMTIIPCFLCVIFVEPSTYARSADQPCAKVEVVFARGSGRHLVADNTGDSNKESTQFLAELNSRLDASLTLHNYELGTDSYNGSKYPAVDIDFWDGNLLGAFTSAGYSNDYGKSVLKGVSELQAYLSQRYKKCKSSDSYYILSGFSQGAEVIGETLLTLTPEFKNRIAFVSFFGDPKLYLPEGFGGLFSPACIRGKSTYSIYRMGQMPCSLWAGILSPRLQYTPNDMSGKIGTWCNANDFVCGTSNNPYSNGHDAYASQGGAVYTAARKSAEKLLATFKNESPSTSPSPSPSPTPTPKPDYDNLIDITHHYGEGLMGQNTVFLIDISDTNKPNFPQIVSYLDKTTHTMEAKGQRFAIGIYGGAPYGPKSITATGIYPFGYGNADYQMSQLRLFIELRSGGGSWPYFQGSVFDGIVQTLPHYGWQNGANKSLVIFSNASNLNGAVTTQAGLALVINASLAIDPVNIYPVVPQDTAALYQDLATSTSGQTVSYDKTDPNGIEQAGDAALEAIESKPVALLSNTEYIVSPGQTVTFDASDSYTLNGEIVTYDWDFDGDGTFETSTSTPSTNHAYTNQFDGYIQVRVTDSNGNYGNASAPIKVGTYIEPTTQEAPTNLTATVIDSKENGDTVQLNWNLADDHPAKQVLSVNGIILGSITSDQTSINVTDVERTEDVTFSVASMNSNSEIGEKATVILTKLQTPFDTVMSSTSSNTDTSHIALTSTKEAPTFGLPATSPITFDNISSTPFTTYAYNNNLRPTSDASQSWKLIIPGVFLVVTGIIWGILRFKRRS